MEPEFDFFKHWYPLSPIEDIDPQQPTPVTLLGLRLVIWKSGSSDRFRVFLDQCPHRLAPLSEGRVDEKTGNLMCSYHGWQFDDDGICTHIPQAEKPQLVAKNKDNFCVTSLPCRQEQDLLWVWPDSESAELAKETPLPLSPLIDASKGYVWSSMVRDLEYDWQTLIENVADPSHVPFTHHGVQGNRDFAKPIDISIVDSSVNLIKAKTDSRFSTTITFEPPCHLEYDIQFGASGKKIGLVTYCLPVSPGKSRLVALFPRNFAIKLHHIIPRWWDHITNRNLVLDGDMIILHQQESFLHQQAEKSWQIKYKMPTSADRLVIEFRNWFDKYCQGQLPWHKVGLNSATITQINDSRHQLLDRYEQHTKHCHSCRETLKKTQLLQRFLLVFFAVVVAVVALLPEQLKLSFGVPLIGLGFVGLGAYAWVKLWLEPRFLFMDYVHSQK